MRYWKNDGAPLPDGRLCLVIDPEDGTQPIFTYGRTKEEVLEKVAKTAETAQQLINRHRATGAGGVVPAQPPTTAAPSTSTSRPSSEEIMQATLDITNPGKSSQAIKTLLRAEGLDLDKQRIQAEAEEVALIAEQWERDHPDFPMDPRNQRILMDKALLKAGGKLGRITSQILDDAFTEMSELGMLFALDTDEPPQPIIPTMQPSGNPAPVSRPRTATSIRRTALNGTPPTPKPQPPKYTRADIHAMDSRTLRHKIENERGFAEIVDVLSRPTTA